MPIPQAVAGQLLDVRRQLAFRDDVEVENLILYDGEGEEIIRIDHFWLVLPPRVRFGDSYESVQFLVTEDEDDLTAAMAATKHLKYEVVTIGVVGVTTSPAHFSKGIPKPPLGRNRTWDIKTTTETFVHEFFRPPGQ